MEETLTYQLSIQDLVDAQQAHHKRMYKNPRKLLQYVLVVVLLTVGLQLVTKAPDAPVSAPTLALYAFSGIFGGAMSLFILRRFWVPYSAGKTFATQKSFHAPLTVSWSPSGLKITSARGFVQTPWSDFYMWFESDTTFLFYQSNRLFHFIPKRFLNADQIESLRACAIIKTPA